MRALIEIGTNALVGLGVIAAGIVALMAFGCVMCALDDRGYRQHRTQSWIGTAILVTGVAVVIGWMVRS